MVQAGLLDAAESITPTNSIGKGLEANFFLPRKYIVIPNGIDVTPATQPAPQRTLQAITAGRLWDEAKGLNTLLALQTPMPILVAGENSFETPDLQHSWPAHLHSLGPLSREGLHQYFRESAIYLCTSLYEPFGLAALEAALCGCAVVARDLPSLHEVWADNALYFHDEPSLRSLLQGLAADAELLHQAQIRAHLRAQHFTPERMADSYLHLFERILRQQGATPHAA